MHHATNVSPESIIAVADREGFVLAVWEVTPSTANAASVGLAVAKAGTAAFLSSGQHAFSTRTAGFIIMQHFPPLLPLKFDVQLLVPSTLRVENNLARLVANAATSDPARSVSS